ncbi:(2,3-dihydroxybenzoyl)adenylate synthase [Kitasatospora mediocidica]|uniref:(2,3-dihydroxybenzoyl)adenylate synthase n=1 Tax=Kitasatospora mediocidica TaxID=58352 RepID=UPI0012FACEAD|nr:AMP-binding protein [Kitasatospora mediocidica]
MKLRVDTLDAILRSQARCRPDRTALISSGRRIGYGELDAAVERLAGRLAGLGLAAGDRVVVQLPNSIEFILLIFALFRLGVIPVLALPGHRRNEIDHLCKMAEAVGYAIPRGQPGFDFLSLAEAVRAGNQGLRHVLTAGHPDGSLDDVFRLHDGTDLPSRRPDSQFPVPAPADLALLLLSGGTTGAPKLIPRTHRDYVYNVRESAALCGLDENSRYLAALPAAHNFALGCPGVLGTLAVGGTVVLAPGAAPDQTFELIARERVTVSALTPPLLTLWLAEASWSDADLSSLRLLQVGGARLGRAEAARVGPELGCRLQQVFGMAEGLLCFTRPDDPPETVLSTQGRPLSAADELRVVDGDEREVAPGEIGELLVRGPYTIRGYYRAPDYDATAFTTDGYYRTGDLVRRTATGHLVVEGRVKDVINRGGEKVPAAEVEDHLSAHPQVAQAAVVGMPDGLLGERSCAYVVPQGSAPTLGELAAFLRGRGLAAYKLPDRLEIADAFPRTGAGKVDKRELAAGVAARLRAEGLAKAVRENTP